MPTYDYQCTACDHEFEHFQSISSPVIKECPSCGKMKLKRLIGPGGAVVFKGSGFYQTDYRSDSYKKRAAEESKSKKAGSDSKKKDDNKKSKSESSGSESKANPAS